MTARETTVTGSAVQLSMQWRRGGVIDVWGFLGGGASPEDQLAAVVAEAALVVVVPDLEGEVIVGRDTPTPPEVVAAVVEAGFVVCEEIPMPDGRVVQTFAAPSMPSAACVGVTSGG